MHVPTTKRVPLRALALFVICGACIERPFEEPAPAPARAQVDRSTLRDVLIPPPADATVVGALFGNAVELLGYKLEPTQMVPGQAVKLTLYWRCRTELERWHIFVHLDDATGTGARLHAEHDPAGGRFPTDAWKAGDLIADAFVFTAPRNPLLLFLGLYTEGENRMALTSAGRGRDDGSNRLLAGILPVAR